MASAVTKCTFPFAGRHFARIGGVGTFTFGACVMGSLTFSVGVVQHLTFLALFWRWSGPVFLYSNPKVRYILEVHYLPICGGVRQFHQEHGEGVSSPISPVHLHSPENLKLVGCQFLNYVFSGDLHIQPFNDKSKGPLCWFGHKVKLYVLRFEVIHKSIIVPPAEQLDRVVSGAGRDLYGVLV